MKVERIECLVYGVWDEVGLWVSIRKKLWVVFGDGRSLFGYVRDGF